MSKRTVSTSDKWALRGKKTVLKNLVIYFIQDILVHFVY